MRECLLTVPRGSFYVSRPNINGIDRVYRNNGINLKNVNENRKKVKILIYMQIHLSASYFIRMKTDA